ncbi:MAG: class I SAM-dependent methyltransferase [Nitrospirae bacterium]|nr:class I SAM-dependent methyltransferase [Nitrospirota bacterium]NTW66534.1 class I SAM-dependent methyltransferase [Nitrospirota bacterium]
MNLETTACPLCRAHGVSDFSADKRRNYLRCTVCRLVFVPSSQFLSTEDEKKRYDLHQNSPDSADYRRFLGRLFTPLQQRLAMGSSGLDFGSGPEPVLSRMFEEAGHSMRIFDQYYEHAPAALDRQYDFITASEVVEHLREPRKELDRLWACLKCGGWLGIMTKFAAETAAFPRWYYKNDLTHVCFFSREAFLWLAAAWNADLTIPEDDVVLIQKGEDKICAGDDKPRTCRL